MANIRMKELHMKTDTLQSADSQLKAVLEAIASAKTKLGSIEFHSTWACGEKQAMYENVQVLLDEVCRLESKCRDLEEATRYLIGKVEETASEAMWHVDIFKKSFFDSLEKDGLAPIANELQGNPAVRIIMEKF